MALLPVCAAPVSTKLSQSAAWEFPLSLFFHVMTLYRPSFGVHYPRCPVLPLETNQFARLHLSKSHAPTPPTPFIVVSCSSNPPKPVFAPLPHPVMSVKSSTSQQHLKCNDHALDSTAPHNGRTTRLSSCLCQGEGPDSLAQKRHPHGLQVLPFFQPWSFGCCSETPYPTTQRLPVNS